jgi:hypothetical protein
LSAAGFSAAGTAAGRKTWAYGVGARVLLACLTLLFLSIGVGFLGLPFWVGGGYNGAYLVVAATGLIMLGFAAFMGFGLIAAVRSHISLDATTLDAVLPGHRTWLLLPTFRSVRLPLAQIRAVERREEIVKMLGLSSLRDALSVVTDTGERIGLFSNANTAAIRFPLDEAAAGIAAAAAVPLTNVGTVLAKGGGVYGEESSTWTERPLDAASASKARRTATLTIQILTGVMMAIFILRACTHQ